MPINSNYGVYHKDYIKPSKFILLCLYYTLRKIIGSFGVIIFTDVMWFAYILDPKGKHIKPQIYYQKCMKMISDTKQYEQITIGKQETNVLKIHVPNNLYIDYVLDGDYNKQIRSISLTRNLIKQIVFGIQQRQVQVGWNITFLFKKPPEYGYCIVRYT